MSCGLELAQAQLYSIISAGELHFRMRLTYLFCSAVWVDKLNGHYMIRVQRPAWLTSFLKTPVKQMRWPAHPTPKVSLKERLHNLSGIGNWI